MEIGIILSPFGGDYNLMQDVRWDVLPNKVLWDILV
jgi:hypothetical protein